MKKRIADYLPSKQQDVVLIQGHVPRILVEEVKEFMKLKKVTWNELLTACLKRFIDESKEE